MSDEMHTRLSRAEWEITNIKETQQRQEDRMSEMSTRMDVHHREVMGAISAISGLREDQHKQEGARQAREDDAKKRQNVVKIVSMIVGVIGLMVALGWINTTSGAEPEPVHVVD